MSFGRSALPFVFLFLSASSSAFAQSELRARLVERGSGKPLASAIVSVSGFPTTAKTDAQGHFTLAPRPAVPFQLIVILAGGQVARPIDVVQIEAAVPTFDVDPLAAESLTVVGAAPSVTTAPASANTLLSMAQIERRSPDTLQQVLETVPGINVVSEGHASVPAIRGLARGRTLILIDGGRVTSERRVGPSATFSDPSTFEGVDVSRGPGSVAYGSDAIGGVISVRTKRAEPGSPLRIGGSFSAGAGVPLVGGNVEVSKGFASGGLIVQAHGRDADDWDSPEDDTDIFNSGWSDGGFLARVDHQLGAGLFSAGWQGDFGRDIDRPRNNSQTVRFYYPFEDSQRFTSTYELANIAGFKQLTFTAFLGMFEQRTDQDRFPTPTSVRSIERADVDAKDFHVKGSATRTAGPAKLEFGIDVNGRFGLEAHDIIIRYDSAGNIASETDNLSIANAHRTDVGAYVQAEGAVGSRLRLSGGIRGDNVTTENVGGFFGDRSTSNGAFSGFGSATVGPFGGLNLTGQVARGFRDPTLSDRYFRGPSGRGFITGNPDLEPETSLQYDFAARYALSRTQLALFLYRYEIGDLIERYSPETDFFFFRNRGEALIRGFEVEARTELGAGFAVEAGLQLGRGEAVDDDANLDDISPDTVSVQVRKTFVNQAWAQLRTALVAEDDRPGPSEVDAPGATIMDLSGGWRFNSKLELRGIVRNLLDDSYFTSPDPRWVYAPGRSVSVTVAVQY
jgi:hemoglobin/transferrin/lactoferrin receptor protein